MKTKINLNFRRFNGENEDEDSGYYNALDSEKRCHIEVNLDDEPFEQLLTIYHEITHFVFDLFCQYEIDNAQQKVVKRDGKLKEEWRVANDKSKKTRKDAQFMEEVICSAVEDAVRKVFKKEVPQEFLDQFFTNKKKARTMKTPKRRKK